MDKIVQSSIVPYIWGSFNGRTLSKAMYDRYLINDMNAWNIISFTQTRWASLALWTDNSYSDVWQSVCSILNS